MATGLTTNTPSQSPAPDHQRTTPRSRQRIEPNNSRPATGPTDPTDAALVNRSFAPQRAAPPVAPSHLATARLYRYESPRSSSPHAGYLARRGKRARSSGAPVLHLSFRPPTHTFGKRETTHVTSLSVFVLVAIPSSRSVVRAQPRALP